MISPEVIDSLRVLDLLVGVDAHESERLVLETRHQCTFLRIHSPARPAPVSRERQHDDLAAEVAQLECLPLVVSAVDLRRDLADLQVPAAKKLAAGDRAERPRVVRRFYVTELGDDALEQRLRLLVEGIADRARGRTG